MRKIVAGLGLVSLLGALGCDEEKAEPAQTADAPVAKTPPPSKPAVTVPYKVTKDELMKPFKRTVEIELEERITEKDLIAIAAKVMAASQVKVERTFIGYRLRGQDPESMYWATTHHNPEREVKIQGLSKKDYDELIGLKVPEKYGEVLGEWIYEDMVSTLNVVYRKEGKLFMVRLMNDGDELSNNELVVTKLNGEVRYSEKGNTHGEYFVISPEGEMAYWGEPLEGVEPKPFHRAPPRGKPNLPTLRGG